MIAYYTTRGCKPVAIFLRALTSYNRRLLSSVRAQEAMQVLQTETAIFAGKCFVTKRHKLWWRFSVSSVLIIRPCWRRPIQTYRNHLELQLSLKKSAMNWIDYRPLLSMFVKLRRGFYNIYKFTFTDGRFFLYQNSIHPNYPKFTVKEPGNSSSQ